MPATGNERTFMEILKNRFDKKYTDVYMVAGSDRVSEFRRLIKKYNGKDYNFDTVEVVSAGERDADAAGATGMSASKMRGFASVNDFKSFRAGLIAGTKEKDAMKLFKDLKKGMGVNEAMAPDDENLRNIREHYHNNDLFNMGDIVENTKNGNVGKVIKRGPNYIQYEMEDGGVEKAWLDEINPAPQINSELQSESVDKKKLVLQKNSDQLKSFSSFEDEINERAVAQDPDIKKRKGTQPKKYYKTLSKKDKKTRDRSFKRFGGKHHDDPDAYPKSGQHPGDKGAKTKPSKHTLKYKKMFGESLWANIHKKRERIKQGSGEKMRKVGDKGAPTPAQMKRAQGEENIEEMPYYRKIYDKIHQITHPKGYEKIMKMYVDLHKQGHKNPAQALGQMIRGVEARDIAYYINGLIKKGKLPSKLAAKVDFEIDESFQLDEKVAGLVKKSEKSGIAYGILKKVYDRGMAAWRTGHRPGTTPQQWGFARVNSFVTKSKGTWGGADKDLAAKARGSKKESYDIGVDYAKHTFSTTPGQKYEQTFKSKKASEQNIKDWFERKSTREEYQNRYKENWKERLKETYNRMLEKVSCDDCNNKYIENDTLGEAEYQGKKVKLNDPFRLPSGSNKKFGVYVKNEKGNIIKVTFGDPNMEIKRDDPGRRKSFRARHNCDNPGPKTKARYWSCFQWRKGAKVDN